MTDDILTTGEIHKNFKRFMRFSEELNECILKKAKELGKEDSRLAVLCLVGASTNATIGAMIKFEEKDPQATKNIAKDLDLPGACFRLGESMKKIEKYWGKVSMKEFGEKFQEAYEEVQSEYFGAERKEMRDLMDKLKDD